MMQQLRKSIKPIMLFIVIIFIGSCFFMYGGSGRSGSAAQDPGNASGDVVVDHDVAVIDGERIALSRLEMEVAQFIRAMGLEASATSADFPAFRTTVIDRMATLKELDREATNRKITASKEEIDSAIEEIESSFPTREIYLQQLQGAGITEAELRQSVEENVKRSKVMEEVTKAVSTDEAELRNYYEMTKEYSSQKPEGFMMDIAHFSTGEAAEAARAELSSGKKWDDVIAAASGDVLDSSNSENRIFIPSAQLIGEAESLKTLSMDIPSKVIAFTSDDHMIAVKRTKEEARIATFDEASPDVEQILLNQKRMSLQSNFMQELRARANVEILDQELFSIPSPDVSADAETAPDVQEESSIIVSGDAESAEAPASVSGDQ
jgi:foldase protein PrsA